jgi:hypothetical protein
MMKDMGIVQGSPEMAVPLIVGKDTVYVHTDITPVEGEEGLFQYHEVQYEKDEYIKMLAEQGILHDGYLLDLDFRLSLSELGV